MGIKRGEDEPLEEFVKRYHWTILDIDAFNYPQALRGLKGVR